MEMKKNIDFRDEWIDKNKVINALTDSNFRVFDYPYHWNDYAYLVWTQQTGICFYPRVGIRIINGLPGQIRARLAI